MVTTNSNAYLAGPPTFSDGVLSYKVSSPHYDSKGAVQVGTYDLAIRSDVARCIYGFTSAPIQASVSIVYDDGQSKSATTVVSEKDNWLRLSAKGFTYSSPTVKVSLTQEGSKPSFSAKTTITCVKGKTSKKVSAVNPKCPTGYKKKA
jgi:phage gp45-like